MDNSKLRSTVPNAKKIISPSASAYTVNHARPVVAPKPTAERSASASATAAAAPAPVQPAVNPASKPATVKKPVSDASTSHKEEKTSKSKKSNNKRKIMFACCIALSVVAIIAVVLLVVNNKKGDNGGVDGEASQNVSTSEEEARVTKDTLDKYTEITIEGYKEVNDNPVTNAAVIVSVKNVSEETVSLAIVMAAMDDNDNVLDTSSIYAEGIQPGQTHTFETFVYTTLTPEQLKNAKYKAYKASTYEAPTPSDGETVEAPAEETPAEESPATNEVQE